MNYPNMPSGIVPMDEVVGEDDAETRQLHEMCGEAASYLTSFIWCSRIVKMFFGCGVGGIVGVYFFKLASKVNQTDDKFWVIVGDVPSAYLVTDQAQNPASAMRVYCDLMDEWAQAVLDSKSLENVFPVAAASTIENAKLLLSRTKFIRERVIPTCST